MLHRRRAGVLSWAMSSRLAARAAWYHNLRANPRASIEIRGVSRDVAGRELKGEERERYYQQGIDIYPGFTLYRRRANREIPVLALDPVD
jgi:deazaflavin-dependent oxidoreductase (nitroreductase family)